MSSTASPQPQPLADPWGELAQSGRWDQWRRLWEQRPVEDVPTLRRLAGLCLRGRQWELALVVLARHRAPELGERLQTRLAQNMRALAQHRPAAYQKLIDQHDPAQYELHPTGDGQFAIRQKLPDGRAVQLGPSPRELPDLQGLFTAIRSGAQGSMGLAVALCGLGDGRLLEELNRFGWDLGTFRVQPPLYIIEPDVGLVLHLFMLHDWSGPDGPIAHGRCRWLVGADWAAQMEALFLSEPALPFPMLKLPQGRMGTVLSAGIEPVGQALLACDRQRRREVDAHYQATTAAILAELLGPQPPRRPRALLIASRYTTVLQYSTRDCRQALEELGWETRLAIEPSPHHDITPAFLAQEARRFAPDLIFAIDALRCHPRDTLPAGPLHVCWVQDDLPRLAAPQAGATIKDRDFVLMPAAPWYVKRYGYPARQCLYVDKLTRLPPAAAAPEPAELDLTFVSNAGRPPRVILDEILREHEKIQPGQKILHAAGERMLALYEQGGTIFVHRQVRDLVLKTMEQLQVSARDPVALDHVVMLLTGRLNNALYRQQALRWVIAVARDKGLSLGLYGSGWEQHPEFAAYARGVVAYGADLERLTRRSRLNLQIVPFDAMHQRLLDGWAAGGFFLVREHATSPLFARLMEWVEQRLPLEVGDLPAALALAEKWSPGDQTIFADTIARYDQLIGVEVCDPVARARELLAEGARHGLAGPPRLAEVSFSNQAQLAALVERYLHDEPARQQVLQEQRRFVAEHMTYTAGLRRVLARMRERLLETAARASADQNRGASCV